MRDPLTDLPRSAVLPDPAAVDAAVVGSITPTSRTLPVADMLVALREMLHTQLDAGLDSPSEAPDGTPCTVLDDLLVRQMAGYGVAIGLEVRHPNADGMVPDESEAQVGSGLIVP